MNGSELPNIGDPFTTAGNVDLMRYASVEEFSRSEGETICPLPGTDNPTETDPMVDEKLEENDIEVAEIPMEVIDYECAKASNWYERGATPSPRHFSKPDARWHSSSIWRRSSPG